MRAIYFDLDDTLLGYWDASKKGLRETFELCPIPGVSIDHAIDAWGTAFQAFGSQLKGIDELYQAYLTSGERTRTHQMQLTLAALNIEDDDLAALLSKTYMERRDANLRLFDDAIEVLETLAKRYPLGLITNGPADIQNQEVDTVGIRKYLTHIFIEGEMRIGKPEKEVFDRAASAMECSPDELLMVGNSFHHDIVPAMKFGWATAWTRRPSDVPPSSRTGEPEPIPTSGPMPTLIVNDLASLLPYLQ